MTFEKEKDERPRHPEDDDWEGNTRLCPECEGRGYVYFKDKRDIEVWGPKEICMTCDGLGVIYDE
jgi:DnaJ-class molecular chaperone